MEAVVGTCITAFNCSQTADAIIYCITPISLGDNFPKEVCGDVLFRGGSMEGLEGLEDPATIGPPAGAKEVPVTTCRA
ncbi:UNVERIFIED_CONTAM: hypothetical protein Sradi_6128600 [Sesamum radiatum]|uniref:Uncharacterized protein n=1 Tax=Sesamum radiatum TaxID=300843 RepID=A0AAW2KKY6_SESRA